MRALALGAIAVLLALPGLATSGNLAATGEIPTPSRGLPVNVPSSGARPSEASTAPRNYSVTFGETGLPTGVSWSIGLQLSNTSGTGSGVQAPTNISFSLPNGTGLEFQAWANGYTPMPWSGKFNVSGSPLHFSIAFRKTRYFPVWINESGLPTGTNWSASLFGSGEWFQYFLINSSLTDSILFVVPAGFNGSYTASPPKPYLWVSGSLTTPVSGQPVAISVRLGVAPILYPVIFRETGLAGGTGWAVVLDGITNDSNTGEIGFLEPNGTGNQFLVEGVRGFVATPARGSLAVAGAPVSTLVAFAPVGETLEVRGWANVTSSGGGDSYCLDGTGEVRTHPAWENVSFAAVAWNGSPPYFFTWNPGDGAPDLSGPQGSHTYSEFGSWNANVSAFDGYGSTGSAELVVKNAPPPGPVPTCQKGLSNHPTFLGLPTLEGYTLAAGMAIAAAGAAVLTLRKRAARPPLQ
ncbi:MAG TPA: PKD domain-containing protein [Thermoplasmata archaeon]|nr:PKD domain-containing protein [Thermoplasmata archaeon]